VYGVSTGVPGRYVFAEMVAVNISVVSTAVYCVHEPGPYVNPVHEVFEKHNAPHASADVTSVFGGIVESTSVAVPPAVAVKSLVTA
jgi:hypothetical protein